MSLSLTYKTLFEVSVLHDFFLDNGIDKFAAMYNNQRLQQLDRYELSRLLEVFPTQESQRKMVNQRMRILRQSDGFQVLVSAETTDPDFPVIPISESLELTFCLRINDEYFNNYTDLAMESNRIYWFTNKEEEVPLMPLMPPPPDPEPPDPDPSPPTLPNIDDDYLASEETTIELMAKLTTDEKAGLFGVITIMMKPGEDEDYDIILDDSELKDPGVKFLIHILNKNRLWKYKKKDGTFFTTVDPQPLVKYGYITLDPETDFDPVQTPISETYCYPNADVISIEKDGADIYSVIFI